MTFVDEGLGTVEDNDIFSNQSVGVYMMNRANPTVRNNTIRDGEGDGVAAVFAARGLIEGNTISNNAGVGILVESEAEPRVVRNKISDAHMDGIRVCDNGTAQIEANTVVGAGRGDKGGSGIVVTNGSSPTVRNNLVRECLSHGILVSSGASGVVERNNVSGCGSHGVVITRQANPVVRSNIVRDNGGIGIWVCNSGRGTLTENRVQVCGGLSCVHAWGAALCVDRGRAIGATRNRNVARTREGLRVSALLPLFTARARDISRARDARLRPRRLLRAMRVMRAMSDEGDEGRRA